MFNRRVFYPNRQKTFKLFLVVLIGGFLLFGLDKAGALNWFRSLGERIFVIPVKQYIYDRRADKCANSLVVDNIDSTLKLKVDQLTEENMRLSKILGIDLPKDWRYLMAKVIAVGSDRLTLSLGSDQGVVLGMTVVVGEDRPIFLGRVIQVTPNQAEVSLLSDNDKRMSVVIVPIDNPNSVIGRGLVIGRGAGQIELNQILNQEKVETGDLVAYQFQNQLVFVGKITDVKKSGDGIFQTAQVAPAIRPTGLLTVFLVKQP